MQFFCGHAAASTYRGLSTNNYVVKEQHLCIMAASELQQTRPAYFREAGYSGKVDPSDNTHRLDQVGLPIDRRIVAVTVLKGEDVGESLKCQFFPLVDLATIQTPHFEKSKRIGVVLLQNVQYAVLWVPILRFLRILENLNVMVFKGS